MRRGWWGVARLAGAHTFSILERGGFFRTGEPCRGRDQIEEVWYVFLRTFVFRLYNGCILLRQNKLRYVAGAAPSWEVGLVYTFRKL